MANVASSSYDGFMSYSHAADGLLAPRLQAGLQRFAKPWWRRRALRVFRDEASLSANPHLWSSITDALDDSGWFILLLSPDAATSEWVNKEIDYWTTNKDPGRILPVVTDGTFGWEAGDVVGNAVPETLQEVFKEEPRWVDLRFARTEDHLDLQNPEFSAAVADIAAAVRGVPKDELASEEVRQHRRTIRTAWAAGILFAILGIAATVGALVAVDQANQAQTQRDEAQQERDRANQEADRANLLADQEAEARAESERQRSIAEQERERAEQQAELAQEKADLARSREFAAAAVSVLEDDPELSMLLALESIAATPAEAAASPSGVLALRNALQEDRLLARFSVTGSNSARISPDGTTIFRVSASDRGVFAIDVATSEPLWTYQDLATIDRFSEISLSPDGAVVAVNVWDVPEVEDELVPLDDSGADAHPARTVVLRATDGEVLVVIDSGACPFAQSLGNGFSPDGRWYAIWTGTEACAGGADDDWIGVYDTTTWEERHRLSIDAASYEHATFSSDSSRVLIVACSLCGPEGATELRSFPELTLINQLEDSEFAALSPDGRHVVQLLVGPGSTVKSPVLVNGETGERVNFLDAVDDVLSGLVPFLFSPDGSKIGVSTQGSDYVFEASTGRLLVELANQETSAHSFTMDGSMLLTATATDLLLWDLAGGLDELGAPIELPTADADWINPNFVIEGPQLAVNIFASDPLGGLYQPIATLLDPGNGEVTSHMYGLSAQLPDGRFVVVRSTLQEDEDDWLRGPIVVWDPASGSTAEVADCTVRQSAITQGDETVCPDGEAFYGWTSNGFGYGALVASADGSFFAAASYAPSGSVRYVRVWDADTLRARSTFEITEFEELMVADDGWIAIYDDLASSITVYDVDTASQVLAKIETGSGFTQRHTLDTEGSLLYILDAIGGVSVFDTSTWEAIANWEAHDSEIRGLALSPNRDRLVTTGNDNLVKVWDVSRIHTRSSATEPVPLLDRIPAPKPSDAAWLAPDRLGVFLADGAKWLEVSLSIDDLMLEAAQRLTRGFTDGECATYDIDPCPDLETIRGG